MVAEALLASEGSCESLRLFFPARSCVSVARAPSVAFEQELADTLGVERAQMERPWGDAPTGGAVAPLGPPLDLASVAVCA